MGKGKVEFIARYTDEDCTVVERKVDTETAIASNDFDFSSIEAYLDCVDEYEKKLLAARNKIGDELFQAMLDSVEAKKGSKAPTSVKAKEK